MLIFLNILLILIALYLGLGFILAIYFFLKGAEKLDPSIGGSKWTVRLLLMPGAMVSWVAWFPKIIQNKSV